MRCSACGSELVLTSVAQTRQPVSVGASITASSAPVVMQPSIGSSSRDSGARITAYLFPTRWRVAGLSYDHCGRNLPYHHDC
jgi:hypothetical protein